MASTDSPLSLVDLAEQHPGVTIAIAATLAEAGAVCLSRHHVPPVILMIEEDDHSDSCSLGWSPPSDSAVNAWADQNDVIEWGAVGVTLAFLGTARNLVAVRRASRGSGADYYLAAKGASSSDLEGVVRLEISGVDRQPVSEVKRRLLAKVNQLRRGGAFEPGLAVVVGFHARAVHLATLDTQ